jgi:hypothetical protein
MIPLAAVMFGLVCFYLRHPCVIWNKAMSGAVNPAPPRYHKTTSFHTMSSGSDRPVGPNRTARQSSQCSLHSMRPAAGKIAARRGCCSALPAA